MKTTFVRGKKVWGVPMVRIDDLIEHIVGMKREIPNYTESTKAAVNAHLDLVIDNLNLLRRSA
jgi:hypothetical protein